LEIVRKEEHKKAINLREGEGDNNSETTKSSTVTTLTTDTTDSVSSNNTDNTNDSTTHIYNNDSVDRMVKTLVITMN